MKFDGDVVLAKASSVRKCLQAIREVRSQGGALQAWLIQDVTVLNLQRAVQACLDLANHLIAANGWELPRSARHSMEILAGNKVVQAEALPALLGMVGFRNIAVHDYVQLDPAVVERLAKDHLADVETFVAAIMAATFGSAPPDAPPR
jgi:uncharacterized protein YutE (UPF0331/DUF86 family)